MSFLKFLFSLGFGFSISIRTPNQEVSRLDNEYKIWCRWHDNRAVFMWEVENGEEYYGRDILIQRRKDYRNLFYVAMGIKDFVKSSKEINLQEMFLIKGIKWRTWDVGAGITETWKKFADGKLCGKIVLKYSGLLDWEATYLTNFGDRRVFETRMSKEIGVASWIGIV